MCYEEVESVMAYLPEALECHFENEWESRDMAGQGDAAA